MPKVPRPDDIKLLGTLGPADAAHDELFLVEGDSAAASVAAVRNHATQAVLALQGKPLNACKASRARVAAHAPFRAFAQALGLATAAPQADATPQPLQYARVLLLMDPDADGMHIAALMLLYVQSFWPWLISQRKLWLVRAPMFELVCAQTGRLEYADNPAACRALAQRMALQAAGQPPRIQPHRGLGSIAPPTLRLQCIDPQTRNAHCVTTGEAEDAAAALAGVMPPRSGPSARSCAAARGPAR